MALAPPPPPSLSLSDIMHPMSPPRERAPISPVVETLQHQEIAEMRARVLQMGLGEGATQSTPRERELYDMVLRLTNPNLPSLDPSQLLRQADTIADLVQQREYLTRQVEEERSRWESEKEGWDRMSEALLVRQSRKVNGPDESELKRICQSLEYDNTALKEKLNHTQNRINALEAELSQLKPHLLMQPFVPRPVPLAHRPPATPTRTAAAAPPPADPDTEIASENIPVLPASQPPPANASASPPKEATNTAEAQPSESTEQSQLQTLQPPSLHALAQASSYFTSLPFPSLQNVNTAMSRKKKMTAQLKKALHPNTIASSGTQSDASAPVFPTPPASARTVFNASGPSSKKLGRPAKSRRAPPQLLASDARAEHLLIAARRLGRERAGIVVGVISAERERMEREKAEREKERIEREKERIEREKRNRGGGGYYRERAPAVSETPKRDESREGSSSRYANAMAGYVNAAGTPVKSDAKGKAKSVSTPTPLDSLLDAARSMQHDDNGPPSASTSSASTGMMTRRRAANANDQAEASAPKRRRLSSNASHSPSRVRTALDVLADQAAVFGTSEAPSKGKGKGKGSAAELPDNAVPPVKRKRGRPPNKDRNKPPPAVSSASRLISPAPVAGPSQAVTDNVGSANTSGGAKEGAMAARPATRWVQRGRLTASASPRAPPGQKDDVESEDGDGDGEEAEDRRTRIEKVAEPMDTEKVAESTPAPAPALAPAPAPAPAPEPLSERQDVDVVVQPRAVVAPRPEPHPQPDSEPQDEMQDVQPEPVIRPTAVVTPRPAVEEIVPATVTPPLVTEEIVPATVTPPLLTEEIVPAAVTPPLVTEEVVPARQDIVAGTEAQSEQSPSPMLEDPVLDADADGESDPDIDMDATNAGHL